VKIDGEVAIVTGASSGIGAAVCRDLVAKGARVAMIARGHAALERARKGLGPPADRCKSFPCDVGDWAAVERTAGRIAREMGDPLILINSAGFAAATPFAEMAPEEMERMLRTNLLGLLHCTRAVLSGMRAARRGAIVNVGSIAGLFAVPHMSVYAATKWAVTGLTESLNAELAREGIHVGLVCPAVVDTPLVARQEARSGRAVPVALRLKPRAVSKAILDVITKERDMIVLPRALAPLAAVRTGAAPLLRWATRKVAPLLRPIPGGGPPRAWAHRTGDKKQR
jgi:short-subunit dehydrogenase